MGVPRKAGVIAWIFGRSPWLIVIIASISPFCASAMGWSNLAAGVLLLTMTVVVIITAILLITLGSRLAWPLPQAGEFLREMGRAKYVTLVAAMFATVCGLLVLLSAVLSAATSIDASSAEKQEQAPIVASLSHADIRTESAKAIIGRGGIDGQSLNVLSDSQDWYEQIPSAVEAFLGAFATILAIGMFYRRLAPYTDLWELVAEISCDMERLSRSTTKSKRIWWCYPGLALGRFRSLNKDGTQNSEDDLFDAFKASLVDILSHSKVQLHAVIYSEDCLDSFYRAYSLQAQSGYGSTAGMSEEQTLSDIARQLKEHKPDPRIEACLAMEKELIRMCEAAEKSSTTIYKVTKPDAMPPFVIVIGSVVYQIANYGAPIFVPCDLSDWAESSASIKGVFLPAAKKNSERLLQLIAYRRDDIAFAKAVVGHIERHIAAATQAKIINQAKRSH